MPSVIVLSDNENLIVRISDLDPATAAIKIAKHYHGLSKGDETKIVTGTDKGLSDSFLTVVLMDNQWSPNSGPDHDLAHILNFSPETVRWALNYVEYNKDTQFQGDRNLRAAGVID